MRRTAKIFTAVAAAAGSLLASTTTMHAQETRKPNILFIMGDDIGWMQPSIYHRGLMVGETPRTTLDGVGYFGMSQWPQRAQR